MPTKLVVTAVCSALVAVSANAQQSVSTTASVRGIDGVQLLNNPLAPFDIRLGTLTGITLTVEGTTEDAWNAFRTDSQAFAPLHLVVPDHGVFLAIVNGQAFDVPVTGIGSVDTFANGLGGATLVASGSASYQLGPSLFDSFTKSYDCGPQSGICAFVGSENIYPDSPIAGVRLSPLNTLSYGTYTLIYSYVAPVPEPATWIMMMLGFTGIGLGIRKSRPLAI